MKQINSLTKEQISKFPEYVEKWVKIGLSTDPVEKDLITPNFIREKILGYKPAPIVYMDNPLSTWLAVLLFYQVWSQVWSQVRSQVGNQVRSQVKDFVYPYIDGHFFVGYFAFYDFMNKELGIEFSPLFGLYMKTTQWGFFYPLENITIICDHPREIYMKNGILHAEDRPAILYAGEPKFEVYVLNGVRVSKEIVLTPSDKLDSHILLKEQNTEVRREIVRKIGIEKILFELKAKVLDDKGSEGYCLYNLDLGDERVRPYLRMFNPSEKVWHLEGVSPEITTVEQALEFRNKTKNKPLILT